MPSLSKLRSKSKSKSKSKSNFKTESKSKTRNALVLNVDNSFVAPSSDSGLLPKTISLSRCHKSSCFDFASFWNDRYLKSSSKLQVASYKMRVAVPNVKLQAASRKVQNPIIKLQDANSKLLKLQVPSSKLQRQRSARTESCKDR